MSNRNLAVRQNPFARLDPWALLALGLPFLLALAAWGWGHHVWQLLLDHLAGGVPTFGLSAWTWASLAPLLALINPILVMATTVAAQKDGMATRNSVYAAMLGTTVALVFTLAPEVQRLAAYRGTLPPSALFVMTETIYKVSLGLVLLAIAIAYCLLSPEAKAGPAPAKRAASDTHGHADWASIALARDLFPGPDPRHGGIVMGEAYRVDQDSRIRDRDGTIRAFDPQDEATWGRGGGTTPLLVDPCRNGPTHAIVFAGSGGFKSTSVAVPTLLAWTGSAVVLDPSGELGPMLTPAREGLGHRVLTLDPEQPETGAFNVLDWIDPADPLPEAKIEAVVRWLGVETSPQQEGSTSGFFNDLGNALIGVAIADTLWNPKVPARHRTLKRVRAMLVKPESTLRNILRHIHLNSTSPLARQLAGSLVDIADETFTGIYTNAGRTTRWLSTEGFADLVSGDTFRTSDLAKGQLTVFVQIPLHVLQNTPALARVIIGALLNSAYRANGKTKIRTLYLLDEAARLNRFSSLEIARDAGRKYGITLLLLYQSVGQIVAQWGLPGRSAWYASTSWRSYAGVQDYETALEVSQLCGAYGVATTSLSRGQGGNGTLTRNETHGEAKRALIDPSEILQDLRADEQIVIRAGSRPIRCGRALYFRRPDMVAQVAQNRFHQAEQTAGPSGGAQDA